MHMHKYTYREICIYGFITGLTVRRDTPATQLWYTWHLAQALSSFKNREAEETERKKEGKKKSNIYS